MAENVTEALEITLGSLELRHEAAAHVASMRVIAAAMDYPSGSDDLSKLANTFLKQLQELRLWVATPAIAEDPWDALSRSLASGASE